MIERIFKRFISSDVKLVLEAMEKVGAEPITSDRMEYEYDTMYSNAVGSGTWVDKQVLNRARDRLHKQRKKLERRAAAMQTAAKILMGEKFEEPPSVLAAGATSGQGSLMQQMQWHQMQQQKMSQMQNSQNVHGLLAGISAGGVAPWE